MCPPGKMKSKMKINKDENKSKEKKMKVIYDGIGRTLSTAILFIAFQIHRTVRSLNPGKETVQKPSSPFPYLPSINKLRTLIKSPLSPSACCNNVLSIMTHSHLALKYSGVLES